LHAGLDFGFGKLISFERTCSASACFSFLSSFSVHISAAIANLALAKTFA
jgi:hypothetical protein